jgi:hypothetical protein
MESTGTEVPEDFDFDNFNFEIDDVSLFVIGSTGRQWPPLFENSTPVPIAKHVLSRGGTVLIIKTSASHPVYAEAHNEQLIEMGSTIRIEAGSVPASVMDIKNHLLTEEVIDLGHGRVGKADPGDAEVLADYGGFPFAMAETIKNENGPDGTIVMIMSRLPNRADQTKNNEQLLHNVYWDAVVPRCTIVCDKVGFFGDFNNDNWSLPMPQGYQYLYELTEDDLLTKEMGTVFINASHRSENHSASFPSDAASSRVFLNRGGTIVMVLDQSRDLQKSVNQRLLVNQYLEAIGSNQRWVEGKSGFGLLSLSPGGETRWRAIWGRIPYGKNVPGSSYIFVRRNAGVISGVGGGNSAGTVLGSDQNPDITWAAKETIFAKDASGEDLKVGGRLFIIADLQFFTESIAANRENWPLLQNIIESGKCDSSNDSLLTGFSGRPTANAGPNQTVAEGDVVFLNGSGSSDPQSEPLTFAWTQTFGTTVTLSDATVAEPTFTAPGIDDDEILAFKLVVSDGLNVSLSDLVNITVEADNNSPVADAGPDQVVVEGDLVTLDGSDSSDPEDDAITFAWTQTAGTTVTLSSANAARPTFIAPAVDVDETLTFQLVVSDSLINSPPDTVNITVNDDWSGANAGPDQTVIEGDVVTLDGTGSRGPQSQSLTFYWSQTAGTTVTLSNASSAQPAFTAPEVDASETLTFRLVISSGWWVRFDWVDITVNNED